jgi:hypothetical protein
MYYLFSCKVEDLPPPGGLPPEPTAAQIGDFYVRIGLTVAAWQFVETSLFNIYACAVRSKQYAALGAAFHMPTSFRVRLSMADEAVAHSDLDQALKTEWETISSRLAKKSSRRNQLIHGIVMFDPKRPQLDQQLFISSNVLNPSMKWADADFIRQSDLDAMLQVFDSLHNELETFRRKLPLPVSP